MKNKKIALIFVGIAMILITAGFLSVYILGVKQPAQKIDLNLANDKEESMVETTSENDELVGKEKNSERGVSRKEEKSVSLNSCKDVKYVSLTDEFDYEDDDTLKNGMCMEIEDSVSENQFLSLFFEESVEKKIIEDSKSKVYIGKNKDRNVFVAVINGLNGEYPKYAYGFKYPECNAVTKAKYDPTKKGEDVFDAIFNLDGTVYENIEVMKPLLDYQEKEYIRNKDNKIEKVKYHSDPNVYGTYNDEGEVFFDKKGRPWFRDYYMTSGTKFSYYLYNEEDELIQYFDFGGMAYKGLEENNDIAIGVDFETYIFER